MQAKAMPFNPATNKVDIKQQHSAATYKKVLDQRKLAIRGLWVRNGRYYAQITVEDLTTGIKRVKRVPLEGAATDSQAVAKFQDATAQGYAARAQPHPKIRRLRGTVFQLLRASEGRQT
jgi:hypothetical protein